MTIAETKEEFGDNADTLCKHICHQCIANDAYCPSYCDTCEWIQRNYDKAIERLAKLDGDLYTFCKRARYWKG